MAADEVQNLTQRTAQAARGATELTHGTVDQIKSGSDIAVTLTHNCTEIETGFNQVSRLIDQIACATNEQTQGMNQVNSAVAPMDKITQQNPASAGKTATAAEILAENAAVLDEMISELVVMVEEGRVNPPSASHRPVTRDSSSSKLRAPGTPAD